MTNHKQIPVGIIGTSWWADAMYLPALTNHPQAKVVAVCGRDEERAKAFAARWQVPQVYTDYNKLIENGDVEALIVATINKFHHPITMPALARGIHVLCEKPLALNRGEATDMAALAREKGAKTLVPFTYRYMPTNRYLKRLLDDGYIGQPYHLNMRYYGSHGRQPGYGWRYDPDLAGSGEVGNLGSHFLYLARWYFGEIVAVTCQTGQMVERGRLDPAGNPFTPTEDVGLMLLTFANGAQGVIHVTSVAYEDTAFGQRHQMELHGSEGTLYQHIDWLTTQEVRGTRAGEGDLKRLPVPDDIWGQARRDVVHDTYKDVFRKELLMTGEFIDAIVNDTPIEPNFDDGLRVQQLLDALMLSAAEGRRVDMSEMTK